MLVLDEFGWDLVDEATLDWLYGQRRDLAAAGLGEAPASLEALREEWEAEHLGLHGFEAMRTAVAERFEERAFARMPFFHRLVGGVATEVLEQALVRRGRDPGARFPLSRRRARTKSVRARHPKRGSVTRKRESCRGESRPDRDGAAVPPSICGGFPPCRRLSPARPQRLTASEAEQLWRKWKVRRDSRSRDRLVLAYAPMVRYIASRKLRELPAHCDLDDLFLGRPRRADGGDRPLRPGEGGQLEQYAWTRVAGALVDELRGRTGPRARSSTRAGGSSGRATPSSPGTGVTPTEAELAAELGTTVDGLRATLEDIDRADIGSLNAPARGADDAGLVEVGETIQAPQGDHEPETTVLGADRSAVMRAAIARLSERERQILALVHVQELPGAEIGRLLGVSESRVSQILSSIRSKLKHQLDTYDAAAVGVVERRPWRRRAHEERVNRELIELLNELRVALPGRAGAGRPHARRPRSRSASPRRPSSSGARLWSRCSPPSPAPCS